MKIKSRFSQDRLDFKEKKGTLAIGEDYWNGENAE